MAPLWQFLVHQWWKVVVPLGVFTLCVVLGFVLRGMLFRALMRTSSQFDDILIRTLRGPMIIWSVILGADLAMRSSVVPPRYVLQIHLVLLALWIVSLTIMAAQLIGNLVRFYGGRVTGAAGRTATLTKNVAQLLVSIVGLLILLNHIGVDIRPLLTALGVGGLAVALALQDTLSNLFAGFYISLAGQIRIGDYVKLSTNEEGYVEDITWRSTTLRSLGGNLIFVPNSKLGQANVTNFNLPDKKMGMSINVRVPYDCDLDRVEAVLLEEARAGLGQIKGMVPDAPPSISLIPGFGDSALALSVNYQVSEFVDQYGVQSEMRRRIFKRFQKEGISMAPAQTVALFQNGRPVDEIEQLPGPHAQNESARDGQQQRRS
jgi:small-conductance mechanosensitive channel